MMDNLFKRMAKISILEGRLGDAIGKAVFDKNGFYIGFINTNETSLGGIIPGPDGKVAGVLLPNGTIQNPDGTKSRYTNPVNYLLNTVKPIKRPEYYITKFSKTMRIS